LADLVFIAFWCSVPAHISSGSWY